MMMKSLRSFVNCACPRVWHGDTGPVDTGHDAPPPLPRCFAPLAQLNVAGSLLGGASAPNTPLSAGLRLQGAATFPPTGW